MFISLKQLLFATFSGISISDKRSFIQFLTLTEKSFIDKICCRGNDFIFYKRQNMNFRAFLSCTFHILDFNIPNLRCGFINLKRVDFFSFNKEKNHLFHIFDDIFAHLFRFACYNLA